MAAPRSMERCQAPDEETLKSAIDKTDGLEWDERMSQICGKVGRIEREDHSDDTLEVSFPEQQMKCWLPNSCVTRLKENETPASSNTESNRSSSSEGVSTELSECVTDSRLTTSEDSELAGAASGNGGYDSG